MKKSALAVLLAALVLSSYAYAENENKEQDLCYQKLDSYVRYTPACDVKATAGEVEFIESANTYEYAFKAFAKLPVKLSLDTQYIGIENTLSNVELPAHLFGLAMGIETTLPFLHFNKTYFRMGLNPAFYTDDGECESSSFRIPSYYYLIYRPSEKWTFVYGVAAYPDFENEVLPILGFIYQPNDKLKFNLVPKRPNITYALNKKVTWYTEGAFGLNSEYEVERGSSQNAVLSYKETRLGSGLKFELNKYIQLSVIGGGMFKRRLKYRDGEGKVDIKDGFYSELRVEIKS